MFQVYEIAPGFAQIGDNYEHESTAQIMLDTFHDSSVLVTLAVLVDTDSNAPDVILVDRPAALRGRVLNASHRTPSHTH